MKKIISKFKPLSGNYCVSNSLKQIFHYNNIYVSEEMLFGLASALNFIYYDSKNIASPIINGRLKIGEFEENLANSIGIKIKSHETASKKRAWDELCKSLDAQQPVMLYIDMAYLPYLNLPDNFHFGGYSIVVFGIDQGEDITFISDRDGKDSFITTNPDEKPSDYHILSIENLEIARSSKEKPFPPKNRWLTFDFSGIKEVNQSLIHSAILKNIDTMLNPPGKNLGVSGIAFFSQKIKDWYEYDVETIKKLSIESYFMIHKSGGTGGGCFRKMFGNFLIESGELLNDDFLEVFGAEFIKISHLWDSIAGNFYNYHQIGDRILLEQNSDKLFVVFLRERELLMRLEEYLNNL